MSTRNDILCVPLKRASDIDVSKPLKNLIGSQYAKSEAPVNLKERLSELQKLRQNAIKVRTKRKDTCARWCPYLAGCSPEGFNCSVPVI